MIFNFIKKTKNVEDEKRFRSAVECLQQGKENYLSVVYMALISKNRKIVNFAATVIAKYMMKMSFAKIIQLDKNFRQYTSIEWYVKWKNVDLREMKKKIKNKDDFLWAVRLGTFHPNGFFREKCINELIGDKESVRFILLRLNDWVSSVREIAESICENIDELSAEDLILCLPYLLKADQGGRQNSLMLCDLKKKVISKICKQSEKIDWRMLKKYDINTRLCFYRMMLEYQLLSKEKIEQILSLESNKQCKSQAMVLFLTKYDFSAQELDKYIVCKSLLVQEKALQLKYDIVGDYWEGLEGMLLSSFTRIRGMTCYILRKHTEFDIISYYIQNIEGPYRKICILGIGECGEEKDCELLLRYLEDEDSKVVKNTLHAIGLLREDKASEIFWKYLQDDRLSVMRQANREIILYHITYGAKRVYDLFLQTKLSLLKEKLAYQLIREDAWDRLPFVLMLYACEDESLRGIIRKGIFGRKMYIHITKEKADWITEILQNKKYQIPQNVKESIEFDLSYVTKK